MKLSLTWSAANGERIPVDVLPKRGTKLPLLDEDGFTRDATVVHCSHGPRQASLVLKVPAPSRNRLPGLTP